MRRVSLGLFIVVAIAIAYALGQRHPYQGKSDTALKKSPPPVRHVLYYVDPMHPSYRSDKPGIAPDCGMQLEAVYAEDAGSAVSSSTAAEASPGAVTIDGPTQKLWGIRLAPAGRSSPARMLRVVGRVTPEDNRVYSVNSGVDGFVRETYHDSVGLLVKKDQKLATYYAPEFISAASGFLAANERVPGALAKEGAKSIQNYTDRLRNLGMSDVQIKEISDSRQLPDSVTVVAPVNGFILARQITPGQHFMRDTEFYRIADLSRVWVDAEVFEQDALFLHPGGTAELTMRNDGRRFAGSISNSLPQSEAGGGTVKVRLEVENRGLLLRPEMLMDVELPVAVPSAVTVPLDAVIDSGEHARVYVETAEGVFAPREVETGWRSGQEVEIRKGIRPGERVVVSATFLVDSESRLKSTGKEPSTNRMSSLQTSGEQQLAAVTR